MFKKRDALEPANSITPIKNPTRLWETDNGLYLGYLTTTLKGENPPLVEEFNYKRDRHIITIGPNGSGKTRRLLVPNLVRLTKWSVVVIDPKGELCRMTADHRLKYGPPGAKVITLDPFNVSGRKSDRFNPVMTLDPKSDDFPDDALNLADALIKITGEEREPHWVQSAQDLMTALIMYVRLVNVSAKRDEDGNPVFVGNLGYVRSLLGQSTALFRKTVREMIKVGEKYDCEELAIKAARFADIEPDNKELNSIISTALTQTRWLDSRPIKADLDGPAHDFSILKQSPTTVYIILPANRLATQSPWMRVVLASIMQKLMKDLTSSKTPTLLMLEEMAQLGHLSAIENNIALMRGFSVKLWGIFQDLSQAQDIYHKRWESFMANAGVLNSFAPQDVITSKYLSERTGVDTVPILTASSTMTTGAEAPQVNIGHSHMQRPTLLPQELRAIHDGFMVGFTHTLEDTAQVYAPFYSDLPRMEAIMALDPAISRA